MLRSKVGMLSAGTSNGSTTDLLGFGFEPKAFVFFTNNEGLNLDSSGGVGDDVGSFGFMLGFAAIDGTRGHCGGIADDAAGVAFGRNWRSNDNAIRIYDGTTEILVGNVTTWGPDGATITWSVGSEKAIAYGALRIGYLALGGPGITGAHVFSLVSPNAPGNVDITSMPFQPQCGLFADAYPNGNTEDTTIETGQSSMRFVLSAFSGTSAASMCVVNVGSNDGDTKRSMLRTDKALVYIAQSDTTVRKQATISAVLANGLRFNFDVAPVNQGRYYGLALAGNFQSEIVNFVDGAASYATVGPQKAALYFSRGLPAATTVNVPASSTHHRMSFGAVDETGAGRSTWSSYRATGAARNQHSGQDADALRLMTSDAAGSQSTFSRGQVSAIAENSVSLSWPTNSGLSTQFVGLAMSQVPSGKQRTTRRRIR